MKKTFVVLSLISFISGLATGCASTSDIDTSKYDQACAQPCSHNYSACVSRFTFFPIQVQHQCTDAYKLCVQGCPERGQSTANTPGIDERLKTLKSLRESGAITKQEYETRRKAILDGV